jgi:DNA-binding transcriptional LysR family regulator
MSAELRHLRAFVAIARAGSISRAARELDITQPALSRTLRQLETAVGTRLVERTTSSLRLSPAGQAMLPRAEAALAAVENALDAARSATWPLRLGHAWSAAGPRTADILRAWSAARPDVPVELRQIDDRYAGLTRDLVDVAVLRGVDPPDGTVSVRLETEPRIAVLAADHRLAGEPALRMADLAEEALVVNTVTGTVTPSLWPVGVRPRVAVRVGSIEDWLIAIAAGQGFGVTAASSAELHGRPGVAFVPLEDAPPMAVTLAWRRGPGHAAREELVSVALAVAQGGS